jgi:hypothetical protein
LPAEHWPQAPEGWQAGAAPPHSPSPAQPRHSLVAPSQTGVLPVQSALDRQPTHAARVTSQRAVTPTQALWFVAEH